MVSCFSPLEIIKYAFIWVCIYCKILYFLNFAITFFSRALKILLHLKDWIPFLKVWIKYSNNNQFRKTMNKILSSDIQMNYLDIFNMHIGTWTGTCFINLTFSIVPKLYLLLTFTKSHTLEWRNNILIDIMFWQSLFHSESSYDRLFFLRCCPVIKHQIILWVWYLTISRSLTIHFFTLEFP